MGGCIFFWGGEGDVSEYMGCDQAPAHDLKRDKPPSSLHRAEIPMHEEQIDTVDGSELRRENHRKDV